MGLRIYWSIWCFGGCKVWWFSQFSNAIGDFNGNGQINMALPQYSIGNSSPLEITGKSMSHTWHIYEYGSGLVSAGSEPETVESFRLSQNYPNPFNPTTVIEYQLSADSQVQLEVFDLIGRRVARLVDDAMPAGVHQVTFDGAQLSSGVYIYRIKAGDFVQTHKMTLIK